MATGRERVADAVELLAEQGEPVTVTRVAEIAELSRAQAHLYIRDLGAVSTLSAIVGVKVPTAPGVPEWTHRRSAFGNRVCARLVAVVEHNGSKVSDLPDAVFREIVLEELALLADPERDR